MTRLLGSVQLRQYLGNFRNYYPGILEWFDRIAPEVQTGDRKLFAVCDDDGVRGLALTKRNGAIGKLCHISVVTGARGRGVGRSLMSASLTNLVSEGAEEIHVTTSEEVGRTHREFFVGAGFRMADWELHRYRRGVAEIRWTTSSSFLEALWATRTILNGLESGRRHSVCPNLAGVWEKGKPFPGEIAQKTCRFHGDWGASAFASGAAIETQRQGTALAVSSGLLAILAMNLR